MSQQSRDNVNDKNDVEVHSWPCKYNVEIGPLLRASKWRGGQWVQYITPTEPFDFLVEKSAGIDTCGFLLFPSENYAPVAPYGTGPGSVYNWTGSQPAHNPSQSGTSAMLLLSNGGRLLFKVFETIALDAMGVRGAGPAVYTLNSKLKVSENGLLCNDPDANLLAATGGTEVIFAGYCCMVPSTQNGNRLGIDLKF
jgi:hypothetical protein